MKNFIILLTLLLTVAACRNVYVPAKKHSFSSELTIKATPKEILSATNQFTKKDTTVYLRKSNKDSTILELGVSLGELQTSWKGYVDCGNFNKGKLVAVANQDFYPTYGVMDIEIVKISADSSKVTAKLRTLIREEAKTWAELGDNRVTPGCVSTGAAEAVYFDFIKRTCAKK